jgi:hypothetical protein
MEWVKVKALSSSPSTSKNKKDFWVNSLGKFTSTFKISFLIEYFLLQTTHLYTDNSQWWKGRYVKWHGYVNVSWEKSVATTLVVFS